MANHKSALKAHRQNVKVRAQNREFRSRLRRALRATRASIESGSGDAAQLGEELRSTVSLIDRMAGKRIIHANAAARYKARLSRRMALRAAAATD